MFFQFLYRFEIHFKKCYNDLKYSFDRRTNYFGIKLFLLAYTFPHLNNFSCSLIHIYCITGFAIVSYNKIYNFFRIVYFGKNAY